MNRDSWLVFLALAATSAVGLLGFTAWQQHRELARTRGDLETLRQTSARRAAHLEETAHALQLERDRAEVLAREMAAITNSHQRLEAEMRAALESRDIAVSELAGRLTVTILDRILFDSGDANLRPEGKQVLDQVAQVLSRYPNRQVQVMGHTDNVPIRVRFPSNWELSTARAVAALRYLAETAGVEPKRLSAVGCGEYQPIADNGTPEGRARNRRIALVVLPEQFTPTDVTVTATNASPAALPETASPGPSPAPGTATPESSPAESSEAPTTPKPAPESAGESPKADETGSTQAPPIPPSPTP